MSDFLSKPPFTPAWGKGDANLYFIYNGASMVPLFKPGDMLCVKPSSFFDVHLGDIVVFYLKDKANDPSCGVHRVISVTRNGLITQGDNNASLDSQKVTKKNLIGLVTSFERQGRLYPIRGGAWGLFHVRVIHARKFTLRLIRRLTWRLYRQVRQSGLVARVWRPAISRIHLMTDKGPLVKYCHGTKTVAHWWPEQKHFVVVTPFDLVISHPEDLKEYAFLD
jgi:signal peptidase I